MRKGEKGFTLVEVTIILLVLVILGAILLPMAERFIDLARLARVREFSRAAYRRACCGPCRR